MIGLLQRVSEATSAAVTRSGIQAEISNSDYQIVATLRGNSLWFGAVTSVGTEPAGLEVKLGGVRAADDLQAALVRILRAEQFATTLQLLNVDASFANPAPIDIEVLRRASEISEWRQPGETISLKDECSRSVPTRDDGDFAPLSRMDDIKQCDVLRLLATGKADTSLDVNFIYIDAQFCVTVGHKTVDGSAAVRKLGNDVPICSECPGPVPYSAGHERLYLLISEQIANQETLNLESAVQNCGEPKPADVTRSARDKVARGLLDQYAQAGRTRSIGLSMTGAPSGVWVEEYRWRVLPRSEALKQSSLSE